jgi:hypothetical protein
MKFIVLGIEVVIPTLSVMMVLDYWLKRWLQQYFYLSISYQIPIEALLIFMLFVMVFYFTSTQINLKVIKTNFQNI